MFKFSTLQFCSEKKKIFFFCHLKYFGCDVMYITRLDNFQALSPYLVLSLQSSPDDMCPPQGTLWTHANPKSSAPPSPPPSQSSLSPPTLLYSYLCMPYWEDFIIDNVSPNWRGRSEGGRGRRRKCLDRGGDGSTMEDSLTSSLPLSSSLSSS